MKFATRINSYYRTGEKNIDRVFDQFQHGYYVTGEKVGQAWNAGAGLMKK